MAKEDVRPNLDPDPIVTGSDRFKEPVVRLRGYVGEKQPGKVRLYWDISLTGYYEIDESDVLDRVQLSPENGSLLVVKASANISVVESESVPASWLQGDITSTFLGGGIGDKCRTKSPPSTHLETICTFNWPPSTHITYAWPPTTRTTTRL